MLRNAKGHEGNFRDFKGSTGHEGILKKTEGYTGTLRDTK